MPILLPEPSSFPPDLFEPPELRAGRVLHTPEGRGCLPAYLIPAWGTTEQVLVQKHG